MFVEQPLASPGSANQRTAGTNIYRKDVTNVGGAGGGVEVWSLVWRFGHRCGGVVTCVEVWSLVLGCVHLFACLMDTEFL